jgi:hypothetical protein
MVSVVWIGMGIYQVLIKPPDSINVDPGFLAPINPVIDTSVIGSMGARIKFDPNLPDTVTPSSTPVASRSATATMSATINKGQTK